ELTDGVALGGFPGGAGRQRIEKPAVLAARITIARQRAIEKREFNSQRRKALLPCQLFLQRGGNLRPETRADRGPRQFPRLVAEARGGTEASERLQEGPHGRPCSAHLLITAREQRFILCGVLSPHHL